MNLLLCFGITFCVSTACLAFNLNETLGEAIYLFICYDVPNAADGWNRSLHSFFFLSLSLFSLRLCFSPEYVCVSIAGLKKIMTRTHIRRRDRKKKSGQPLPPPPSCVRAMISLLSFSLFSKDSRRGAHKAHSTHTHSLCLSFLCPYVYLHSNVVRKKSFLHFQYVHNNTSVFFFKYTTTYHLIDCRRKKRKPYRI